MKNIIAIVCVAVAATIQAEQLKTLTEADNQLLAKRFRDLSPSEKTKYRELLDLRFLICDGGEMNYPGTPAGKILIVNLQKRVPAESINKIKSAFVSMMEYDLQFIDKDAEGDVVVRVVDKPDDKEALTVWPDKGRAEVNVAALAVDNPKPAFLAARTRKEILRGFSCATAGSSTGDALFGKIKRMKDLDNVAVEDFTLDIIMRVNRYLGDAGVNPVQHTTYREVLEAGYDVAPTNGYQKAIYEAVKKTTKLTKKIR